MARRALLLDLDGTLWDSRPWYADVLSALSNGSAEPLYERLMAGKNIVNLARDNGVSPARFARAAAQRGGELSLYPGTRDTLEALEARGTALGAVTNLPGWLARPLVEATALDAQLEVLVTPRRGLPAKPRPHGIRHALGQLRQRDRECVWFVGDGAADADAAAGAGLRFAWAAYGYDADAPPNTEVILASFPEVLEL